MNDGTSKGTRGLRKVSTIDKCQELLNSPSKTDTYHASNSALWV